MARRHTALRRQPRGTGGVWLTICVVLLAVAACVLVSPPRPQDVAAIFAHTSMPVSSIEAVTLPAREWYIVDAGGQAVAACGKLLEAEIIREAYGELASIRHLVSEEVALRITATPAQLSALRQGADAIGETFRTLETMAHIDQQDAQATAKQHKGSLQQLCAALDEALAGTENPVVRGLAGLTGSCHEAMSSLAEDAPPESVRQKHASLALQYVSFIDYLLAK